jgi:hypothetical protein
MSKSAHACNELVASFSRRLRHAWEERPICVTFPFLQGLPKKTKLPVVAMPIPWLNGATLQAAVGETMPGGSRLRASLLAQWNNAVWAKKSPKPGKIIACCGIRTGFESS